MDLLLVLRLLTVAVRLALATALIYLVVKQRSTLSRPVWVVWTLIAASMTVFAVDNAAAELLSSLRRDLPEDAQLHQFYFSVYHFSYLLNAVLVALWPAAAIAALGGRGRLRSAWVAVAIGVVAVGGVGLLSGTQESWDVLLRFTRILSFVGIGAYLGFWTFFFLGRLPRTDVYLAGFLAVRTIFELLVPVQEVFFQMVGRASSNQIWHVLQFLQVATESATLVIVLALIGALGSGRPLAAASLLR